MEIQKKEIVSDNRITNSKQLLIDHISSLQMDTKTINETIELNNGRFIIKKVLMQQAGTKNQNGRIYPKDIMSREVEKYKKIFIKENRAYGELDHPDSQVVNIKNACITIENLWWEGDLLYGNIEVLTGHPSGDIVAAILRKGKTLGISSRALGSVKELAEDVNTVEVQEDLEFVAWDIVSNPSTFHAFVKLNESITREMERIDKYFRVNEIIRDIICDSTCTLSLRK